MVTAHVTGHVAVGNGGADGIVDAVQRLYIVVTEMREGLTAQLRFQLATSEQQLFKALAADVGHDDAPTVDEL